MMPFQAMKLRGGFITGFDEPNTIASGWATTQDIAGVTWSIVSGTLRGAGSVNGCQSVIVKSGITIANGFVEADVTQADNGGIVFRYTNNTNYYLMTLSDASASTPNSAQIYRRVAGTFTLLANLTMGASWVRGVSQKFRVDFVGTGITGYRNGASIGSITDSSFTSGLCGLRAFGSTTGSLVTNIYESLRIAART